jgi:phage portal protein BeeE
MSWDMQQAAVVEFRKLTREEVAAVFDIPPVLLGILDRATFSNVEELHLAFYQDTLGPWTTLLRRPSTSS